MLFPRPAYGSTITKALEAPSRRCENRRRVFSVNYTLLIQAPRRCRLNRGSFDERANNAASGRPYRMKSSVTVRDRSVLGIAFLYCRPGQWDERGVTDFYSFDILKRDVRRAGRIVDGFCAENLEFEFAKRIAESLLRHSRRLSAASSGSR
jgi:hypothetical protein